MTQRVCLVTHTQYPLEPRSRRMAEALVDAGYAVVVLSLAGAPDQPADETIGGVRVQRLPVARHQGAGALVYLREYARFFGLAAARLWRLHREQPFDLIQVHNPPDALIFATLPMRLRGVPVILDLRELMPELFMSRFGLARDSAVVRVLTGLERLACAYASGVLVLHERHRRIMQGRGVSAAKLTQVMNCPDDRFFRAAAPRRKSEGFRLIYHGTLPHRYGVDLLIRALPQLAQQVPGLSLEIIGFGDTQPALETLARDLGVADIIRFRGYLPLEQIPDAIRGADVGVVPMRKDIFTDCGLPTKLLEYVALNIPAVVSRTLTTTDYFDDEMVQYFVPDDVDDLAAQILALYRDPVRAAQLAANARRFVEAHNWAHEKLAYLALLNRLLGTHPNSAEAGLRPAPSE